MPTYGLQPTGFVKKTQDICLQEMKSSVWNGISTKLNLASVAPMGQLLGIISEREGMLWDALEAVWAARDPNQSSGSSLKAVALLTGTRAQAATPSLAQQCTVNVNNGFSAAAGTMFACLSTDPTAIFENVQAVPLNTSGSAQNYNIDFVAVNPGPTVALASTLSVISTPLSGWNSITNPTDAIVGLPDDTDATLRARRQQELSLGGSTTADAIRSAILQNLSSNITNCIVLANMTDAVDANGLLPHSFETIVRGLDTGANSSINVAQQIWNTKCAGDDAVGSNSAFATDLEGATHAMGFTWVATENVYLIANISINALTYPVNGDTQVQEAMLAVGASYNPGDTVVAERLKAACFSVTGVMDVPTFYLGFSPSPTGAANLPIGARQIALLDSSRIVINHV